MLKRIVILVFIMSAAVLLAMAPMNKAQPSSNVQKFQNTVDPAQTTVAETPIIGITLVVGETSTPGTIPVTGGGGGLPMSTLIIFGLLAVIGIGIVLGGLALLSRRQQ